ncbi:uncharacterized protein GGS22DRAFT_148981 [Annulohypoxylon maeteangense]|uniref:uncharacterized protein n=1 Tax=Annulohypoxylon maeteangense TaxID=1927788 RepID=UPI0020075AD6|nr:uncharacterized protein GGS22DRAFT_148981 [Annulohypoxylon maeteangense]KAI0889716.1 hypothetical protein GGS22DRAFT_148981 [Annulohypoxylon maeteangense]
MSANASTDPAAAAAAAAAARADMTRLWTLYSFGVSVTILRTYARIKAIGARNLQADDILVWVAILFYSAQTALAHNVGAVAQGLANNGMTDVQRATISPSDPEYQMRVIGSKIQMAGWATYAALMCFLKLSVLAFYIRLTNGLSRRYLLQIRFGFALVIGTSLASILAVLCGCSPFYKNWQINPDPGNHCQPAISRPIIWTSFAANASTDIYLILIPIPMLWGSSLRLIKKVASSVVLGAGIFVLVCAMLKTIFVTTDPINGAELAGEWGTVEAFVAVFTTNLPMIFPLFKAWLKPVFSESNKPYVKRSGFNTIGGGSGGSGGSASRKRYMGGPPSINPLTTIGNDSLEHIVNGISLQELEVSGSAADPKHPRDGVYISKKVEVTSEQGGIGNDRRVGRAI